MKGIKKYSNKIAKYGELEYSEELQLIEKVSTAIKSADVEVISHEITGDENYLNYDFEVKGTVGALKKVIKKGLFVDNCRECIDDCENGEELGDIERLEDDIMVIARAYICFRI